MACSLGKIIINNFFK